MTEIRLTILLEQEFIEIRHLDNFAESFENLEKLFAQTFREIKKKTCNGKNFISQQLNTQLRD